MANSDVDARLQDAWEQLAERVAAPADADGLTSLEAIVARINHPALTELFLAQKATLGVDEVGAGAPHDDSIAAFATAGEDKPAGSLSVLAHRASRGDES